MGDLQAVHGGQTGADRQGADLVVISIEKFVLFGRENGGLAGRVTTSPMGDEPRIPERMVRILEIKQDLFCVQFLMAGLEDFQGRPWEGE